MTFKFAAFAMAALLAAAPALADTEDWDFIVTNTTGKSIKTFELSPAGTDSWQPNKIDPEVKREPELKTGGRATIHFDKDSAKCKYDLKATFADDTTAVWTNVNVCDASFVTLKYANSTPTFSAN